MIMKKFHSYIQHDAMQCGITCLQMICKHYGKEYTLAELSKFCFSDTEGVSMLAISQAANQIGLKTICAHITLSQIVSIQLPCIIHWNQSHFVVLYDIKQTRRDNRFYIADPNRGKVTYDEKSFNESWISTSINGQEKGVLMHLAPTPSFYTQKSNKTVDNHSFSFLFQYIKQYRKYFGQIIVGLAVGSLLQLILPFLTQAIVDKGIVHKKINFIYLILLGQFVLTVSRVSIDFIRRWLLLHISMRINISLVSDFFIKLLNLPMSFFDSKQMGDLMQRMNDHTRVEKFLTTQSLSVLFSLFSFFVFGFVLFSYDKTIFVAFLVGSIAYGVWITTFLHKRKYLDYLLFERQSENNNKTYQFITSMQEIKLQNCERRRRWEWEDVQASLFEVQMKNLKLQQTQEAGSVFINEMKNIIITVLSATAVINGEMTLGMMLAVQYIIGQLNSPIEQLVSLLYSLQDVKISLERINEVHMLDNEDEKIDALEDINEVNSSLYFRKVDFKYNPHSLIKNLDGITITIPEGKITAIVGTSGSGKTTMIKMLLGYYLPLSGIVSIGNTDIQRFNLKWWRNQCGVVMQDGVIFAESIARNIAVDDSEIDKEKLLKSVKIANIAEFIESLPLKYDTVIGQNGVGLSQGQRQRILIARAVYKNPRYIFLDEATNSLDTNNEKVIVENLNHFYKGKTVVIVAHRLSTVQNADQIIVIDKGHIIETGKHSELITQNGAYYRLIKNQLSLGG